MSLVSVVIPVYNGADYIESCVRYLDEQTHPDREVIFVVDSKTTDGTPGEVRRLSEGRRDIRLVIQTDTLRMGGARNLGLREAKGRYVWFMDVDDRPYPTLLEEMTGLMESHSAKVSVFNAVYSYGHDLPDLPGDYRVVEYGGMEAVYEVGKGKLSSCPWCKIFDTEYLRSNGLEFKAGYCEDFDQTVRSFMYADKVVYYNKPLYVYYQHAGSLCGGANDDAIAERDVVLSGSLGGEVRRVHPESYDLYCAYMARHVIRSLTRASREKAMELAAAPEVKELVSHRQPDFNAEVVLFRFSPSLYYRLGRRARDRKFSDVEGVLLDPLRRVSARR